MSLCEAASTVTNMLVCFGGLIGRFNHCDESVTTHEPLLINGNEEKQYPLSNIAGPSRQYMSYISMFGSLLVCSSILVAEIQ